MNRLFSLMIILILVVPNIATAQEELTKTYSDQHFTFQYPANWVVLVGGDSDIDLSNTQAGAEARNVFEVPSRSIHINVSVFPERETITIEDHSPEFLAGFTSGALYMFAEFMTDFAEKPAEVTIRELEPFGDAGVSVEIVVSAPLSTDMLIIALANGTVVIAEAPTGELEQWHETVSAIAESVTMNE